MAPRGSRFIFLDKGHPVKNAPVHGGQDAGLFDRSIPGVKPQPGKTIFSIFFAWASMERRCPLRICIRPNWSCFNGKRTFFRSSRKPASFAVIIAVALVKMAKEAALYAIFRDHHFKGSLRQGTPRAGLIFLQGPRPGREVSSGDSVMPSAPSSCQKRILWLLNVFWSQSTHKGSPLGKDLFHKAVIAHDDTVRRQGLPTRKDLIIVGKLSFGNNTARADIPTSFPFPGPSDQGSRGLSASKEAG